MRINWLSGPVFVLAVLCLSGCASTKAAESTIPEEETRANRLYGYQIQTPFRGKQYVFAYGDIRVEGVVTQHLNTAVQGITSKKQIPFRGNAKYTVDMAIGDAAFRGKISVELDCFNVDLTLNGSDLGGSKNVYALEADGLVPEELAVFFLVDLLKTIHYDMHKYHARLVS
jgi:hypothetical protein